MPKIMEPYAFQTCVTLDRSPWLVEVCPRLLICARSARARNDVDSDPRKRRQHLQSRALSRIVFLLVGDRKNEKSPPKSRCSHSRWRISRSLAPVKMSNLIAAAARDQVPGPTASAVPFLVSALQSTEAPRFQPDELLHPAAQLSRRQITFAPLFSIPLNAPGGFCPPGHAQARQRMNTLNSRPPAYDWLDMGSPSSTGGCGRCRLA